MRGARGARCVCVCVCVCVCEIQVIMGLDYLHQQQEQRSGSGGFSKSCGPRGTSQPVGSQSGGVLVTTSSRTLLRTQGDAEFVGHRSGLTQSQMRTWGARRVPNSPSLQVVLCCRVEPGLTSDPGE